MPSNDRIFIRVTQNQRERIISDAHARGFKTISQYLRALALETDGAMVRKLDDIYNTLIPNEKRGKLKEKPLQWYF